jgi:dTDP-4-dehydrorhamnose reductase
MTATTAASISNSARTALVVGGDSFIGEALVRRLRAANWRVWSTTRRQASAPGVIRLDLGGELPELPQVDAAVICAARARLNDCAADPVGSRRVNVDGAARIVAALARQGAYPLFLSTDKVFDGLVPQRRREEATCPRTEYGRQKADAERAVRAVGGSVLRLCKVVSPELPLIAEWRRSLLEGRPITPFTDMFVAPVPLAHVCRLIERLLTARMEGVFHCTGAEDRSYAALAEALAAALEADVGLIRAAPCDPEVHPLEARPPHSTLAMDLETARFGLAQPAFADVLRELAFISS